MATILSNQWLAKRRPYWDRLAALLGEASAGGVRQLSRAELRETALLYRQAASDVSTLRQDSTARAYAEHVNQLLARAHHIIYSSRRKGFLKIFYFLRDEYPLIVQRQIRYVLLALVMTLGGALLGSVLTLARPQFMRHMLGPAMVETIERHEMWTHSIVGVEPVASSAIMTNNLSVCFVAFAGGIVFGLGTIYSMFFNGLLLGVIGVACAQHGMSVDLWSFVAPHGSLELPSIILSGGAGLRLAQGVLFPGLYRRRDSIALAGVEATRLVSGVIPLLVIAGTLEGFFSPSSAAVWLKFTVGGLLFTLLLVWLFRPVPAAASFSGNAAISSAVVARSAVADRGRGKKRVRALISIAIGGIAALAISHWPAQAVSIQMATYSAMVLGPLTLAFWSDRSRNRFWICFLMVAALHVAALFLIRPVFPFRSALAVFSIAVLESTALAALVFRVLGKNEAQELNQTNRP
jgi:uncharacterized membrane protein SpoIIM required for sporulation